ncbi:hypothetical protein CW714_02500, partial [Methanophagales archaeon]
MMFIIFFISLFADIGVVSAADYYVATWGSDSNNGTSLDAPWQHPSYATQQAKAGDTIYLMDGVWHNEYISFANSGTKGNPIVMTAYNGTPTLIGSGTGQGISIVDQAYITIDGITIENYDNAIYGECPSGKSKIRNIEILNCKIKNCNDISIWIRSINSTYDIPNLNITNNTITDSKCSAMYLIHIKDSIIKNNYIENILGEGCMGIGIGYYFDNTIIENNYLTKIATYAISGGSHSDNNIVRNNTIENISGRGIRFDKHYNNNTVINNTIKNTEDIGIDIYPDSFTIVKSNYVENSSLGVYSGSGIVENNTFKDCRAVRMTSSEEWGYGTIIFKDNIVDNADWIDFYGQKDSIIQNNIFMNGERGIVFYTGTSAPSENVTIRNNVFYNIGGTTAAITVGWSPVTNLTIKNNIFMNIPDYCIENKTGENVIVAYNDVWGCSSPYFKGITATNTLEKDPLFADPPNDFHLKSQYGRWNGSDWVTDSVTSPCIDAGDPADDYPNELDYPNGYINMGAYGNTVEASRSPKIESKGVYYVAPYGDDANNGITLETAWRHISHAASKAQPGDTILIVGGVYKDEHVVFTNSGNATHPIVMKAYNGTPTLDGVDKTGVGIKIPDKSYIEIYGLKIKNYDIGIKGEGILQNITIGNFTIEDIKSEGLNFDSASLQNSIITNFIIRNTGGRAISHYDFGSTDCHDVEISHFIINDIDSAGILWENAKRVHIHHGEIHNTTGDGIRLYKNLNCSVVEHVLVNKTGWHGIAIHDPYMNRPCYDNIIRNCEVIGASHGAIDLHSGAFNTTVENCTLVGPPYTTVGIYFHNRGEGLIARNNVIKNMLRGIYADAYNNGSVIKNAVFVNNTIYNDIEYSGGDGQNGLLENISFINNTFINCSSDGSYSALSFWYGRNVLLKGNRFINPPHPEEPQIQVKYCTGDVIIEDLKDRVTKIRAVSTSAEVRFTDGKVFSENGINTPYWHPDKSNYSLVNETVRFITHNMTAVPSSGYATITVNKFNTSLPQGEILVNFTSNTTNGTNVVFTIGDLIPNKYYLIRKDCNSFTTKRADSTGHITFSNSEWRSAHTFTVEEIPPTPRTGLVGLWHFDEGAGTTAGDSSGNNNNGTLIDNPDWVDGKIGKALEFNGSTNYVEINDSDS